MTSDDPSSIEIELRPADGGSPRAAVGGSPIPEPDGRRRRRLLLALGAVSAAIVVGAVVVSTGDVDDDGVAPTTDATRDRAEVVPSDGGEVLPAPELDAPVDTALTRGRSPLTVATYPPATGEGGDDDEIGPQDLQAALAAATTDRPLRTTTDVEIGDGGFALTAVATSDPDRGRYRIDVDADAIAPQAIVVDTASGIATLVEIDGGIETTTGSIPNDELADGLDQVDVDDAFRRLMLGPLRSDTVERASAIELGELVHVDGVVARRFDVELPVASVPEWVPYRLAPIGEAAPPGGGLTASFSVYVSADRRVVRVTGANPYGATTQRIVHTIEQLDDAPTIELPAAP